MNLTTIHERLLKEHFILISSMPRLYKELDTELYVSVEGEALTFYLNRKNNKKILYFGYPKEYQLNLIILLSKETLTYEKSNTQ